MRLLALAWVATATTPSRALVVVHHKHKADPLDIEIPNPLAPAEAPEAVPATAAFYGPKGCVSSYRGDHGSCIMQTNCMEDDIESYMFGFTCVDENGTSTRHVMGDDSFKPKEKFDTLVKCSLCLGLDHKAVEARDPQTLESDVSDLKEGFDGLKTDIEAIASHMISKGMMDAPASEEEPEEAAADVEADEAEWAAQAAEEPAADEVTADEPAADEVTETADEPAADEATEAADEPAADEATETADEPAADEETETADTDEPEVANLVAAHSEPVQEVPNHSFLRANTHHHRHAHTPKGVPKGAHKNGHAERPIQGMKSHFKRHAHGAQGMKNHRMHG